MKISFNARFYGFFGFLGFLGFMSGTYYLYMAFLFFFFFAYARPKTKEGTILSDERWSVNGTRACRNAFFVFLIPTMLSLAFLRTADGFLLVTEAVPIAALLTFAFSFVYYDWRGD